MKIPGLCSIRYAFEFNLIVIENLNIIFGFRLHLVATLEEAHVGGIIAESNCGKFC